MGGERGEGDTEGPEALKYLLGKEEEKKKKMDEREEKSRMKPSVKKTGRCDGGGQQILSSRACRPRSCSSALMACDHHRYDNMEAVCVCVCVHIIQLHFYM